MSRLHEALRQRIVVLDGAMGTMIQAASLTAQDFGGAEYEGCNEYLNLTRPDVIRGVHEAYLEAGADIISTNTFGCAPYVLGEYGLADRAHEITLAAARLAREAAGQRFVVGAMGPSTRSISVTRNVTFDQVREAYALQAAALIAGGVDALLLETVQDTLNVKAAALGVRAAMREAGTALPLMVSVTIEPMGTMLAGQGVEALYVALEHLGLFSIGLNCATGPEFMTDHLRSLAALSTRFVSVYPNAGLPDERGQYAETPASLAFKMKRFVDEGWVNIVGGCCGTTPAHIRALKTLASGRPPRVPARAGGAGGQRDRGLLSGRRQPAPVRGRAHQRDRLATIQGARRRRAVRGGRRGRTRAGQERRPGPRRVPGQSRSGRARRHGPVHDAGHPQGQGAAHDRLHGRRGDRGGAPALPGQVDRELDQSGGRRGAVREGGAPAPCLRRRGRRRLHRRGQAPGHGGHAGAQARHRRALPRAPHAANTGSRPAT